MKKALLVLMILGAVGGSAFGYYRYRRVEPAPTITTAAITRGDIADTVGATGTLQAVTTVQVGTQVSGAIQELHADFNSLVRKGQVIARLDPSLFQTQIEQANANLIRAQADLERLKVGLDDARTKLTRARELSARQLISQSELDAAEVAVRSSEAQIRSSEASVTQAEASLNQNKVNLQHTVITAPIDGLVISRNVDVGQTVAASMNAPTLFILAADLTKMQVVANLDESDVGRIRPGQLVTFRVDAYPAEDFFGTVAQVRLQPIVQQNVVTYATVIDVANPELKLKPGMTANVTIEIARRSGVLRVPNAALRFRPTNEIYAALGQTPLEGPLGRGRAAGTAPRAEGDGPTQGAPLAPAPPPRPPGARGAADPRGAPVARRETDIDQPPGGSESRGGPGGRGGGAFARRLQNMSPEERAQMMERRRARGLDPMATEGAGRGGGAGRGVRGAAGVDAQSRSARSNPQATTIDALFGPLPPTEGRGRVWLHENGRLMPVPLRLGITDGQATELIEGELAEGAEIVTNVITSNQAARPAPGGPGGFPFMGQPGRGGFGGGNRGGGR
jgi:HlyD family secretion protein